MEYTHLPARHERSQTVKRRSGGVGPRLYTHSTHTQLARPSEEVAGLWVKTGELVTQTSGKTTEKSF